MTTRHEPDLVSVELLALTRELGRPERDLVILAEGNTSQRLDDGRLVVKAAAVRRIAYSVGGLTPLTDEAVAKFFARDDIAERRGNIAAGRL